MAHDENVSEGTAGSRFFEAGLLFRGARDFLLAYEVLGEQRNAPAVRASRAPWPRQAWATCLSFALELALKCQLVLDGTPGVRGHSYEQLFKRLSARAQEGIVAQLRTTQGLASVEDVLTILRELEGSLEKMRYVHEQIIKFHKATFHEGKLVTLVRAVHQSIVAQRPDFAPWPGIIHEG